MKEWGKIKIEGSSDWATGFCKSWRGPEPATILPDRPANLPSVLRFGTDLTFPPPPGNLVLVTQAYEDMFRRLLCLRGGDTGSARGAVVTGQPGTGTSTTRSPPCSATHRWIHSAGKTTFLTFMLAQLLSAHQVVLYYSLERTILFYRGEVYTRSAQSGFRDLPYHPGISYCPVWTFIDMDYSNTPPPMARESRIWPIQASSPRPSRWESWRKQTGAALLGMPLWNMEELVKGYAFALFPLFATDPGHAVLWRFVADRPPPLQLPPEPQSLRVSKRTGEPAQWRVYGQQHL